jgi:uncharacterized protein YuzE
MGKPFTTLSLTAILRYPKNGGDKRMKLHYYPETDSLYIDLNSKPSVDSREIVSGLVADFDAEGSVVGLDIDHASQKLDLKTLETVSLPTLTAKAS